MIRKIVFVTGTRADFGKLKSLIKIAQKSDKYKVEVFVTGMHLDERYGLTVNEIHKSNIKNIHTFVNHNKGKNIHMDRVLAKTINGFSDYIHDQQPDLVIVHGDRVEALACAISGSLNNILVVHIEGGEVSGTIDELIRHSVSKMSHIHLVANLEAKGRLLQLGELESSIHILGSPDLDLMNPLLLPKLSTVKDYYTIDFDTYAIAMFHPVTTEYKCIKKYAQDFVKALIQDGGNYIVIFPNNDLGSFEILNEYKELKGNAKFNIFPSLRFEYFLTLLKGSEFIIGNSSAGIREANYYNIPTIDIGTRQNNRAKLPSIFHTDYDINNILNAIQKVLLYQPKEIIENQYFGTGNSDKLFLELLSTEFFWGVEHQKQFQCF
jgi:UDP-N-acetylglucosamine 2-epimerase (hydrolysing)